MGNRLAASTSPYLLQHADNPVHWWPWCDEAFDTARRRGVPVLISVGYAACHWCHVMAHESFEDPAIAELLNTGYVPVKVDREERPDVDAVYMAATQAMTGQGGWPMTVFATPDRRPFFCGTYFPRDHFERLLRAVAAAWRDDRDDVVDQARRVAEALAGQGTIAAASGGPAPADLAAARDALAAEYDSVNGGFGGAPKFPPAMVCAFLLSHHERTGDQGAYQMAAGTLAAMAGGGIYDQLGGGFARYSVDASWTVPHFEKMLYDNALLAGAYARWWRHAADDTHRDLARRVALETCAFMVAELTTAEGGFASSLDADSAGAEGTYYVWTPERLRAVLGDSEGRYAAELLNVSEAGTFEGGSSVLQLRTAPEEPARWAELRSSLLAARGERQRPARDDKVVAAWNGLAIGALAEAGMLLDAPQLIASARAAARLLVDVHIREGRLVRTSRAGVPGDSMGVLEDYADVASGFLTLHAATGEGEWLRRSAELVDAIEAHFPDDAGGFYDTADDAETLLYRPRDPMDGVTPSGRFAAARVLLDHAALTGDAARRESAAAALGPVSTLAPRAPRFAGFGLSTAEALIAGPVQIAVVGAPDDPRTARLRAAALAARVPAVIAVGAPGVDPAVPLLADRTLVDGAPAGYVCRDFSCRLPVTDPAALGQQLAQPAPDPEQWHGLR